MTHCRNCRFYSISHHACFHPEAWTQGTFFKRPGDPDVLNPFGHCWFDEEPVHPVGFWAKLKRFFRTVFVFKVTRREHGSK